MKKIININLSGRVIPIEDLAYEKLQGYIESLRRYFSKEEDRDEIINDIESRIAELMNEKIRKGAACITDTDIDEIIASMGRPEDLDAAELEANASSSSWQKNENSDTAGTYRSSGKKRLYRDVNDKMLGGVCAGIANFINMDPAIVRLLFAIITFGGFGAGLLIYILLWIILPAGELDYFSGKRLYRNPEERVFGGVASGLAAYFNKETWMFRLLFAAPLLLNIFFGILSWPFFHEGSFVPNIVFGSLCSTFIIAYIILWIVLPEAKSPYQQMEMRGEKVDVNTIRQNVKVGTEDFKNRMKEWSEEVKESAERLAQKAKEYSGKRGKNFAAEAGAAAGRAGRGIGHMIGVIFKAFFLFVAGAIAFGLFVALMGLIFSRVDFWPLKNFLLDGFWQNLFAWGTLILFLGVPLLGFIIWILRRIMRVKSSGGYLGWTFGGLWTLGWISVALLSASISSDFQSSNDKRPGVDVPITQPAHGKMLIKVSEPEIDYTGNIPWLDIDGKGVDVTSDTFKLSDVRVYVEQSPDSAFHVEIKKYSRGNSVAEAQRRADDTKFNYSYSDSVLDIGSGVAISKENKYRYQHAIVTIRVPVGKKIRFDETLDKLHRVEIRVHRHDGNHRRNREEWNEYFDYDTDVDYVMGENGYLVNTEKKDDAPPNIDHDNYRYNEKSNGKNVNNLSDSTREKIDEEKRKSDERIKQMIEQDKEKNRQSAVIIIKEENHKELAMAKSNAFSLADTFF